ncbi:MAG: MFS transporter [Anaerolineae bacterium]|nr:MFS transporter [Anaerolineae bacterium]
MKRRSESLLVTIAYAGFVASGLSIGMIGVAWPSVRETFALRLDAVGLLLFTEMIGNLLACFCGGLLISKLGVGRVLLLSALARGLGSLGYGLAPTWWLMVVLGVVAGAGGGGLGVGMNTYFATNHSPARMNWLHASYGLGAALGPAVMRGVLGAGGPWRWGYVVAGLVLGLMAICFALTLDRWRLAARVSAETPISPTTGASSIDTLKVPLVWAGVALIFCFAGTEVTAGQWAYSLFTEARSIDPSTAGFWASVYWMGSTVGRVFFGFIAARFEVKRLLRVAILGAMCSATLIWVNAADLLSFLGLAMLAFMLAPVFPLVTSTTPERVGAEHGANAIGFQVAAASLGATFLPALAGVLAERVGLEVIGPFLLAASAVLFLLHEMIARRRT